MDEQIRACYEQTMSEWLGCEAIVRQREKEQHAAALAKCASGASVDCGSRQDSTISTDVNVYARVAYAHQIHCKCTVMFACRFIERHCVSLSSRLRAAALINRVTQDHTATAALR